MRKNKKGFTIVELVIVIAVIAVLTAVLVPTFIHLSSKAKDSIDKTVVKNANIQLAAKQGLEGKNRSMSDAVKDVDEIGYHIPGVETGNGNKIVWDSVADRFVLLDKDGEVMLKDSDTVAPHSKLFFAVSVFADHEDFAIYAKSDYSGTTTFTEPLSFDAGDKEDIESISYSFSDEAEVLVATNSEDTVLTVNAPNATFKHDNLVGKEHVEAVAPHSFSEFGKVGFVKIDSGHYIADQGANVKGMYVTTNDAVVDEQNGGVIESAYGDNNTVTNEPGNVDLSYGKSESQVETKAMEDLDHDINPVPAVVGTAITDDNWQTTLAAGEYYLSKDFEVTSEVHGLKFAAGATVSINLNGHTIRLTDSEHDEPYCLYIENGTLTVDDTVGGGAIVNDSGSGDARGIYGIYSAINVVGGVINGSNPKSIGALGSNATMLIKPGTIGGIIFVDSPYGEGSVTLYESGTYKISCEGLQYGIAELAPTVYDKDGNTISPDGGLKTYPGGLKYMEYVIA